VEQWQGCTRCFLKEVRHRTVLVRGDVPCDVLMIGEAPGKSEDDLGAPFVGPAGQLLDQILKRSVPDGVRVALTNLVACIPLTDDGKKLTEPPVEAVEACTPRLLEIIDLANPAVVVCVGTEARDWLDQKYSRCIPCDRPMIDVLHPAYILRQNYVQQGLLAQQVVVAIGTAVDEYVTGGRPAV
jgi:DNA polymerase